MCVCVCERSLGEWVPLAGRAGKCSPAASAGGASPRAAGLQLPECREPGGGERNREAAAKGGSEPEREGRKPGASQRRRRGRAKQPR